MGKVIRLLRKFADDNGISGLTFRDGTKHTKIYLQGTFIGCVPNSEGTGGDRGIKNLYAQLRRAAKELANDSVPGRAP